MVVFSTDFNTWTISLDKEAVSQYDDNTIAVLFRGVFPAEYDRWLLHLQQGDNYDVILLEPMAGGYGTVLSGQQLHAAGHYSVQLEGEASEDRSRRTNIASFIVRMSMSGDERWPEIPTAFSDAVTKATEAQRGAEAAAVSAADFARTAREAAEDASDSADEARASLGLVNQAADRAEEAAAYAGQAEDNAAAARDAAQQAAQDAGAKAADAEASASAAYNSAGDAADSASDAAGYSSDAREAAEDASGSALDAAGYAAAAAAAATAAAQEAVQPVEQRLGHRIDAKQDALTAGDNIIIEDNVISASGGMTPKERAQLEKNTQDIEAAFNGFSDGKTYPRSADEKQFLDGDDLSTMTYFIDSNGKWARGSSTTAIYSYMIPADGFSSVSVKASAANPYAAISFLARDRAGGDTYASFCDGYGSRIEIDAAATATYAIPADCVFINVMRRAGSTSTYYTPDEVMLMNQLGGLIDHEKRITALEDAAADKPRSVIIGASIEAGTTHETDSPSAVINASKAYLTVALQRNGHEVTNLSEGGMGFVRQSQHSTNYFRTIVDNTNFSQFDCCWISLGTNDWAYDFALGSASDASGASTVCGQLKYGLEKIAASNLYCKIIVKLPELRGKYGSISTCWGWGAENKAAVPYTQEDMENALIAVCDAYCVEAYGKHGSSIVNAMNLTTVLPDKTHPSVKTMALMADALTGAIPYKRRG